ncbi:Fc.00g072470.m01.CDS01 [Cosmosporella sp. VM-42]
MSTSSIAQAEARKHRSSPVRTEQQPMSEHAKAKTALRPAVQSRQPAPNAVPKQTNSKKKNHMSRGVYQNSNESLKNFAHWFLENQASLSFNLIALLFLTHSCMPKARPFTSNFFRISHYNPSTGNYAIGGGDLYFITFCIVLLTGLRASFLDHLLRPLAKYWGITKKGDITRFSEQAWLLCYYAVFYTLGVYIYCTSKYYLNLKELWTDYPTRDLPWVMKFYILGQWSFWLQQVLVINIEERRKDYWQMLTHHIVTIGLISTCYAYHFTRIGNLILILMDVVDIFFPLAKCLKYLGYTTLCDIMFGIFVLSWFVARHVFYMITMWSMWVDMPVLLPIGCFHGSQDNLTGPFDIPDRGWSQVLEPFTNPSGTICYSANVRVAYLCALGFLQLITIMWFFMIVRVVMRVIRGASADDPRSDSEEEVEEEFEDTPPQPITREVGVDSIDLKGWEQKKKSTTSSGISLPGHSDRKELLGRIGCEKHG